MARYNSGKHRVVTPDKYVLKHRISRSEIAIYRAKYLKKQGGLCPICGRPMRALDPTLDHCHRTGKLRGVLCRNCNGLEGKLNGIIARIDIGGLGFDTIIRNLALWRDPSNLKKKIHPNVETEREQKIRQRKRAAMLRKKRKPVKRKTK